MLAKILQSFKYFTKSFLIESNNASIREKRNQSLNEYFLNPLEDKLYFVLNHFDHSKDEVRVQVIFDLDTMNLGLMDISRTRFDLLPTVNFFEDGHHEFDDSRLVNFRHYSNQREWQEIVTLKPVRKQVEFRKAVLRAYNNQCAICSINTKSLLRAAHIIPVASGGDDSVKNGLCLCVLHEVAFDKNELKITPDGKVEVKEGAVLKIDSFRLRFPNNVEDHPSLDNLRKRYVLGEGSSRMGKYGLTAVNAVGYLESKSVATPLEAWHHASIEVFEEGTPSQLKGCPKNAFLGLCEAGLVRGVSPGSYNENGSQKNKGYALKAIELLKLNPGLVGNKNALWKAVIDGGVKRHNSQMDVVVSLWERGLIVTG